MMKNGINIMPLVTHVETRVQCGEEALGQHCVAIFILNELEFICE